MKHTKKEVKLVVDSLKKLNIELTNHDQFHDEFYEIFDDISPKSNLGEVVLGMHDIMEILELLKDSLK